MKKLFFLLLILPLASSADTIPSYYLTPADAAKILGQSVLLTQKSADQERNAMKYRSAFTAVESDPVSGNTGNVFYNYEEYSSVAAAQKTYTNILDDNRRNGNIQLLSNTGDEAFYQSDAKNFDLIMVRKKDKIIRMKVNKVTSTTSVAALKETIQRIAATL
ncbi:hypothetical protein [Chitinophaga arvensicola]|nr:hypothetical protein [Chitinophaga arvensicola]